ncbi:MAG: rod shape-determining protein MreC [Patescibacteria group bacterium]
MKRFLRIRRFQWLLLAGAVILLVFLQLTNLLPTVGGMLSSAFKPVQIMFISAANTVKSGLLHFGDVDDLRTENERLSQDNIKLIAENLRLQQLLNDGEILSEEQDFIAERAYSAVTAKVIGKSSDQYFQMLIINRGTSDGIKPGYPVFVNDGLLIGKIWESTKNISKILLLTNNHSEISAVIQNNESSQGVIVGQYGISLTMELIPHDHSIANGQLVQTSGDEELVPEGLIIGQINEVTKRAGELFQEASIQPLVDFNKVRIVSIILPIYD